jgi:pilus assembly protein Flp/PilA
MITFLRYLHQDERGATATEYALLIVFVALAIAVGAQALGSGISNLFNTIATNLASATVPTP